jgi:N-acetylglucosamine-6-phosphate deacetylase
MKTLIRRADVINPNSRCQDTDILIEHGRIIAVGSQLDGADFLIDATGCTAIPGMFDIHAHGADGADVCDGSVEALRHIATRKLAEGVTTWLPTTLTQARSHLREIVKTVAAFRSHDDLTRCPGLHIEGPFINREKAGAQNPEFVRLPDIAELLELHAIAPACIVSLAPEMPGAIELIRAARAAGITCSAAHTSATYAQISDAIAAGLSHLTHFGNAMTPLHHREIGVVGAGLLDPRLMIEAICDTIHLCPDMLRLLFHLVPRERILMITDSVAASWIGAGEITLGGLPVTVQDGIARLKKDGTLAGSTLRAHESLRHVAASTGLPLEDFIQCTSWNQAQSLGLHDFGKIAPGFHADITLLDPSGNVVRTMVAGISRFIA